MPKTSLLLPLVWLCLPGSLSGQRVIEVYQPASGVLRIGPGPDEAINRTDSGYTLIMPERQPVGSVVMLDGFRVTIDSAGPAAGSFEAEVDAAGLALLRLTTGNPLDFYFTDDEIDAVIRRIQSALEQHGLRDLPVFLAGMSLAGTRALRVTVRLSRDSGRYWLVPAAVAVVDSPLDMERFWHAEQAAIDADFHPAAAGEGRWVSYLLEQALGGTPAESYLSYLDYSPYTHSDPGGGNARWLTAVPLRAYHEPDVDWWIEHRRKSYYQMNSLDLAALVNRLKLSGNDRAELITSHGAREGFAEGSSPHTWSMVDNAELVRWFLAVVIDK